jgi:lysophospholipase L1-like esterase
MSWNKKILLSAIKFKFSYINNMIKRIRGLSLIVVLSVAMIMGFRNTPKQVVCFGDSITCGALVDGKSWVYFLSQDHSNIDFINAGRSGRKTSDGKELLPVLGKYPNADWYLIFLGVNDLKDGTDSMVNQCVTNMRWMIGEIKRTNNKAKIVILSPADINLETMNDINKNKKYNQNTEQSLYKLEEKYQILAKEEHVRFISLLHVVSAPNYVDGLHPNIEGQKEIAKAVWKKFKKL